MCLRQMVHDMRGNHLDEGKLVSRTRRLTKNEIDSLQNYYEQVTQKNKGDLDKMKKDVWAIYFYKLSTDDDLCHVLCPEGEDSWYKYNRSLAIGGGDHIYVSIPYHQQ